MANVIPNYDSRGLLPEGEHVTSSEEFIKRFVKVKNIGKRGELFTKYIKFCSRCLETNALKCHYVNGSYVTNKEEPSDIDLLIVFDGLTVDEGPDELYDIYLELDNKSDVDIKENYSCHTWCVLEYSPDEFKDLHDYNNRLKNQVIGWWKTHYKDEARTIIDPIPKGVIVLKVEEIEKIRSS
ncbi:hypothetical protein DSECCO2_624460 [anaerobic digester metagenome]